MEARYDLFDRCLIPLCLRERVIRQLIGILKGLVLSHTLLHSLTEAVVKAVLYDPDPENRQKQHEDRRCNKKQFP